MAGSCWAELCVLWSLPGRGEEQSFCPSPGALGDFALLRVRAGRGTGSAASGRRGAEPLGRRRVSSAGGEEEQRLPPGLQLTAGLCWGESGLGFGARGDVQCRMWWWIPNLRGETAAWRLALRALESSWLMAARCARRGRQRGSARGLGCAEREMRSCSWALVGSPAETCRHGLCLLLTLCLSSSGCWHRAAHESCAVGTGTEPGQCCAARGTGIGMGATGLFLQLEGT